MLARILPIIALLVLCILGYWLWSQGTLQQIIRPTVMAVETKRQLIEGQKVRKNFIEVKEVAITSVEPGMITFPEGTTADDVEKALSAQTIARNVDKGRFLRSTMLGESSEFVVLRAKSDIQEGDALSLQNLAANSLEVAPPGGAIVFDSEEEATLYINKAYDLNARKMIFSGQVLTIDDAAGGSDSIYVVQTSRDFSRSERLSINGLESTEMESADLPSGAIAFQTRGAADVFIASAGKFILSDSVMQGTTITADMLSAEQFENQAEPSDLPRTLAELTSYMKAYPDQAMFLDKTTYVGTRLVQKGETVDIWVEQSRSGGAFGQINMVRLAKGVLVREAEDSSGSSEANSTANAGNPLAPIGAQTEDVEAETKSPAREYLWVAMNGDVKKRFDAAKGQGKAAFTVRADESMVDLLGNGAACLEDTCQVSRSTSDDLEEIMAALAPETAGGGQGGTLDQDPLAVMDGVSFELEDRLRANNYSSFAAIAAWSDDQIPAVTIKLDISSNLAFYIREQARILSQSASKAARDLGFDEAPNQ